MGMEADIRALLLANAGVSALIGTRLYPLRLPAEVVLPAGTFQRITTTPHNTLTGTHGSAAAPLQIDSYAATDLGAWTLAEAIIAAIEGVVQNGNIQSILLTNALPLYDVDLQAHRVLTEFRITYTVA